MAPVVQQCLFYCLCQLKGTGFVCLYYDNILAVGRPDVIVQRHFEGIRNARSLRSGRSDL